MKLKQLCFKVILLAAVAGIALFAACNHGLGYSSDKKYNRSAGGSAKRTAIDGGYYKDFTAANPQLESVTKEVFLQVIGGDYYNGESFLRFSAKDGVVELNSTEAVFEGKKSQLFGKFRFDIQAASKDCMYLKRVYDPDSFVIVNNVMYQNERIPDVLVCLPLYGYGANRIEVSNIMDGFILMPSGTYWKK